MKICPAIGVGGLMTAIVLSTELMMGLSKSFSVGHTIVINNKTGASVIGRLGFFVNYQISERR